MNESSLAAPDLTNCDREPIHTPGSIQPHGVLLVLDPERLTVLYCSANTEQFLGVKPEDAFRKPVADLVGDGSKIVEGLRDPSLEGNPLYLSTVESRSLALHAVAHRYAGRTILELEAAESNRQLRFAELYPLIRSFPAALQKTSGITHLAWRAAAQVRRLTGFDRVLVYRFEPDWTGVVIAEDGNGKLPSYLNHRFPASDIPRQARDLYRLNRLRLIPNGNYNPVPILSAAPDGRAPLDLTYSVLRSVSPVHLEYMRNMGTAASMSISVLRDGQLWGLISCHHSEPKFVSFEVRTACDLLAQMLMLEMVVTQERTASAERRRSKDIQMRLLDYMTREPAFIEGLVKHPDDLLGLAKAQGAAVLFQGACELVGATPSEEEVRKIADWLASHGESETFETTSLGRVYPRAQQFTDVASGMLAISISKIHSSYVLWFRPEVIQRVKWAGDPHKEARPEERISPRKSFAAWEEHVRGCSESWGAAEVEAAVELRNGVIGTVLRRAEQMAELTAELKRSNQELEAFSYSVSHDLRAPFRHISGYAELLREDSVAALTRNGARYVDNIIESAQFAGLLVDNLLSFSQIGRSALNLTQVAMNDIVREVRADLKMEEVAERHVSWRIADLPKVTGDPVLLRQVMRNLLSNALKYTRSRDPAVIDVNCDLSERETVFRVHDNGVGFDMAYSEKLFGVFQRLHKMEDFEGTGIGLAIVRRIVNRHGGRTWAESAPNQGATFYFTIPN